MDDDFVLSFLVQMTARVAELHAKRGKHNNAGPRYDEANTFEAVDEGFARWMGWRGDEAQETECSWNQEELKRERLERSYREIWKENRELKDFIQLIARESARLLK